MKTFKDLEFKDHPISNSPIGNGEKMATMSFDNGYGVSVIFGSTFYSNGINTYELALTNKDGLCYDSDITNNDVLGYITEEEVSETMKKIQELNP